MSILTATGQILSRLAGRGSGTPTTMLSRQLFHNEDDKILWVGTGDDGTGKATGKEMVGGAGFVQATLGDMISSRSISIVDAFGANVASSVTPAPAPTDIFGNPLT